MRKNLFLTYSTQHPNVAPFHKIFHLQLSALYIYTIFTPSKYLKYSKIPSNFQKSLKHQKKVNPNISNYRKPTINDTIIAIFTETFSTSKRFNKSTIAIPPIFAHSFFQPNFQKSLKKQRKVDPKNSNHCKSTFDDTNNAIFTETPSTSNQFNLSTKAITPIFVNSFFELELIPKLSSLNFRFIKTPTK